MTLWMNPIANTLRGYAGWNIDDGLDHCGSCDLRTDAGIISLDEEISDFDDS
jgi:hypothetical protein